MSHLRHAPCTASATCVMRRVPLAVEREGGSVAVASADRGARARLRAGGLHD